MHAVRCGGIERGGLVYVHQIAGSSMINRFLQLLTISNYITTVAGFSPRVIHRAPGIVHFLPITLSFAALTWRRILGLGDTARGVRIRDAVATSQSTSNINRIIPMLKFRTQLCKCNITHGVILHVLL